MRAGEDDIDGLWSQEEQAYWLAFDHISGAGLGVHRIKILFERMHTLKAAWTASLKELKDLGVIGHEVLEAFVQKRKTVDPFEILAQLERSGMRAYPLYHPLFPPRLRQIHDPPLILYVNGKLHPDDMRYTIGVVGTRRPTSYGQRYAKEMSKTLAHAGATIISGMAVGVDSLAHWGAIEGGGKTLAVLGCGADVCYPSSNRPLFRKLVEGEFGAVVSEFAPGIKPETWRFPARNRIISGLSQALLVIEAGETSGSLITARLAFEQNREVFAVPGRIDNQMSQGTNGLIRRQMAHLCTNAEDIFNEMNWVSAPTVKEVPAVVELYGKEKDVFALISVEPIHFDHLVERSGMPAGELSATLTMLELAGIVERLTGDWYVRTS